MDKKRIKGTLRAGFSRGAILRGQLDTEIDKRIASLDEGGQETPYIVPPPEPDPKG